MPARPDNPDGFWENLGFVSLNDGLLGELGGAWDLPPALPTDFQGVRFDSLRERAAALIGDLKPGKSWGWKDPRNCLTLPFWEEMIPGLKVVIIVRNPLAVAHSMRIRNGTSYAFGLRMWEIYNRRVFEATEKSKRFLTHYESFFDQVEPTLRQIVEFCGLPLSRVEEASALVTRERRHTHFTIAQMEATGVSPEIISFYQAISAEALREFPPAQGLAQLPSTGRDKEFLAGAMSRVDAVLPEQLVDIRDATLDRMRRDCDACQIQIGELSNRLNESEQSNSGLSRQVEDIRARFVQTNQLLHRSSISLGEAEQHNSELTQLLRRELQAMKKLLTFLSQAENAAHRLRESRRWKLANLFAWLAALLRHQTLPGFGHLDNVMIKVDQWRRRYPELTKPEDILQTLSSQTNRSPLPNGEAAAAGLSHSLLPPTPLIPLEFPSPDEVLISVIIPVFNKFRFTQACLASLQQHQDNLDFEVIVVDDGSRDETVEQLTKVPGLRLLPGEGNAGFIASCNRGAAEARAPYLLFLNNDTVVTAGWLSALYNTFRDEPTAGLVGSKFVYPDGRLQEAGGIIWQDASGWNRGKYQDADKPEFNYLREVDYCSAASVMIPKSLFDRLGGFDAKYAPGYYEDTDLAFKVRAAGRKVLYQPLSRVIHYEGVTGGTDLSAGAKQYQERNRTTFADTWKKELAERPSNGDLAAWDAPKPGQKQILVIDHHLPMPDRDSGSLRMSQILRILHHLGNQVTFLPHNLADIPPYGDDLRRQGIEVTHYPYAPTVADYLKDHGATFDAVILSRCDFARQHLAHVRSYAPQARLIFDTVDLHFLRTDREARLTLDPLIAEKARATENQELQLIDQSDETWVVSKAEQAILQTLRPGKRIEVVSNIVDVPGSALPFSSRQNFLFIGSFQHTPNTDAVVYFTREVYPMVKQRLGRVKFYIIGDKAPPEVIELADENVIVSGLQPEVAPFFDSVKLSVAPLRFGAGVKGKINQSMAFGVPVVATSIAVEGMELSDREDVLIADAPEQFARALVDLYHDEQLWERISRNGIAKTKASYSREAAEENLSRLFGGASARQSLPS